jgi:hypothetical protein
MNKVSISQEFTFQVNLSLKDEHLTETTITHISVMVTTTDDDDARVQALSDLFEEGFSHWYEVDSVEVLDQ